MKKILALVGLLSVASFASAQETYSVTVGGTTTNRNSIVGQIQLGRSQNNSDVCARAQLPATCTQAQACTALNVPGGASCTGAQAIAAEARIYPDSLAGRESFVGALMVRAFAPTYLAEQLRREQNTFQAWCRAASQGSLDAVCSAAGLPAGCYPCAQ